MRAVSSRMLPVAAPVGPAGPLRRSIREVGATPARRSRPVVGAGSLHWQVRTIQQPKRWTHMTTQSAPALTSQFDAGRGAGR